MLSHSSLYSQGLALHVTRSRHSIMDKEAELGFKVRSFLSGTNLTFLHAASQHLESENFKNLCQVYFCLSPIKIQTEMSSARVQLTSYYFLASPHHFIALLVKLLNLKQPKAFSTHFSILSTSYPVASTPPLCKHGVSTLRVWSISFDCLELTLKNDVSTADHFPLQFPPRSLGIVIKVSMSKFNIAESS